MRFLVLSLAIATTACGIKLTQYELQVDPTLAATGKLPPRPEYAQQLELNEDAGVSRICLQWYADKTYMVYDWKCLDVSELREILFKNTDVF